jgi:hypothetical protein
VVAAVQAQRVVLESVRVVSSAVVRTLAASLVAALVLEPAARLEGVPDSAALFVKVRRSAAPDMPAQVSAAHQTAADISAA